MPDIPNVKQPSGNDAANTDHRKSIDSIGNPISWRSAPERIKLFLKNKLRLTNLLQGKTSKISETIVPDNKTGPISLPNKDKFNKLSLQDKILLMTKETANRLSQPTNDSTKERLARRVENFSVIESLIQTGEVENLSVVKGWVGDPSARDGHTSQFHELELTFKDGHTEKFQPDSNIQMQRSGVLKRSKDSNPTDEQNKKLSFHGVCEFKNGAGQTMFHYQDRQMKPSEYDTFAKSLFIDQVPDRIEWADFSNCFKAVVAQKKLLTALSPEELATIGTKMNQYFHSNDLLDLRNSISLSNEQLASAWMMKLSHNRGLSDRQFLTYMKRGETIFKEEPQTPLQMETSDNNDIPAIAWYLKGVSGKNLFEKGATRVHLSNQNKTWELLTEMQSKMKERISTHFGGTKLTNNGYGKDIPSESLRDDMPFQFGALLMYPTSRDAKEDMFALKLSKSPASSITEDFIKKLYEDVYSSDISHELLSALMKNKSKLTSKLSVFRIAKDQNPDTFNIDIGIKLEDFGHGDTFYHTAVHSKVGKPRAFIRKKIWKIGCKKTPIKKSFSTSISGDIVKMPARKEHMSTLSKEAQELALELADLLPEFKRGTKTRLDFSFKSLRRGMQEDTVQMKTGQTNSMSGRDLGETTSIKYLMDTAAKLNKNPDVKSKLAKLESILSEWKGLEGEEETLDF